MFNKVTKILNKGIEAFGQAQDIDLKEGLSGLQVISSIISRVDESDFDTLDSWIKKYVSVELGRDIQVEGGLAGKVAPLSNPLVYDAVFRGKLDLHLLVIFHFIQINFLDSIKNLAGLNR